MEIEFEIAGVEVKLRTSAELEGAEVVLGKGVELLGLESAIKEVEAAGGE